MHPSHSRVEGSLCEWDSSSFRVGGLKDITFSIFFIFSGAGTSCPSTTAGGTYSRPFIMTQMQTITETVNKLDGFRFNLFSCHQPDICKILLIPNLVIEDTWLLLKMMSQSSTLRALPAGENNMCLYNNLLPVGNLLYETWKGWTK